MLVTPPVPDKAHPPQSFSDDTPVSNRPVLPSTSSASRPTTASSAMARGRSLVGERLQIGPVTAQLTARRRRSSGPRTATNCTGQKAVHHRRHRICRSPRQDLHEAFAVHVAALHQRRAPEVFRERLKPEGWLYGLDQAPGCTASGQAAEFSEPLGELLRDARYEVDRPIVTNLDIGFVRGGACRREG